MKKIASILILMLFFSGCLYVKANAIKKPVYLMDYPEYKNLREDNIASLRVIRYTEGGAQEKTIKDREEVLKIYNFLKRIRITNESNMSCTDNTTIYSFKLNDNSNVAVEIECNWIVFNGKNYNFTTSSLENKKNKLFYT